MNEERMMYLMLYGISLVVVVFTAILIAVMPLVVRKSLLFGVRIPESAANDSEVRGLKTRYLLVVLFCSSAVIGGLTAQYFLVPRWILLSTLYAPLSLLVVQFVAYIPCHTRAVALKKARAWQTPNPNTAETATAFARTKLVNFPVGLYLISLAILLVSVGWTMAAYPSMPESIPVHWGVTMQPDAWAEKSVLTALSMPLVAIGTLFLMAFSNGAIYRTRLQISPENPQKSYAQHALYRKMQSTALGFLTLGLSLFFSFMQLMAIGALVITTGMMVSATVLLILASILPFLYITLKAGQGGCKLEPPAEYYPTSSPADAGLRPVPVDRSDDRFWKLGLFYYNPDDPALLVEDRFGINGGLNYARPAALAATGLMLLLLLGACAVMTVLFLSGGIQF